MRQAMMAGLFVLMAGPAMAADVMEPVRQFLDGLNKGDMASANAAYASGTISIIDEFAPHLWVGPHAGDAWAAAFGKLDAAEGVSDDHLAYGTALRAEGEGDFAYAVVPVVYTFKVHGAAMREEAQMSFALRGEGGVWKIGGWAFAGAGARAVR